MAQVGVTESSTREQQDMGNGLKVEVTWSRAHCAKTICRSESYYYSSTVQCKNVHVVETHPALTNQHTPSSQAH